MQTTSDKLKLKYGDPYQDRAGFERRFMRLFKYPDDIRKAIPVLGESLYCNMDIWPRYVKTLRDLIKADLHKEIRTNDECFCVRDIRGFPGQLSTHSWGVSIDLNQKDNPLGMTREQAIEAGLKPFSKAFIQVWRDNGWLPGIDFKKRPDGMHFEGVFVLKN
jgi:hypothetical protein